MLKKTQFDALKNNILWYMKKHSLKKKHSLMFRKEYFLLLEKKVNFLKMNTFWYLKITQLIFVQQNTIWLLSYYCYNVSKMRKNIEWNEISVWIPYNIFKTNIIWYLKNTIWCLEKNTFCCLENPSSMLGKEHLLLLRKPQSDVMKRTQLDVWKEHSLMFKKVHNSVFEKNIIWSILIFEKNTAHICLTEHNLIA